MATSIFELIRELKAQGKTDDEIYHSVNYFLEDKARETHTPKHGHFELTPLCNLDCKMCYVHLNKEQLKGKEILPVETWKDLMNQAIEAGMVSAALTGGECLTYPGFDELYLFLRSRGVKVNVLTNGILLNEKRIEFFKKHRPKLIQVTLYGSNNDIYEKVTGHRMFETVFKNILDTKEAGLPIRISITPSKYIKDDIKNIIDLLQKHDLPYAINICLTPAREETGRKDNNDDMDIDDYVNILKYDYLSKNKELYKQSELPEVNKDETLSEETGMRCGAGRSGFSINWQGIMTPCPDLRNINSYPLKDGIAKAWEDMVKQCSSFPRFKKCENCPYKTCCVYCAGTNEQLGSRYILSPTWCIRAKKMVESGIRKIDVDS